MIRRNVRTAEALHARPLDRLVREGRKFSCKIKVLYNNNEADIGNVVQLLLLAVPQNAELTLVCDGADEHLAAEALAHCVAGSGQTDQEPPGKGPLQDSGPSSDDEVSDTVVGRAGAPGVGVGQVFRPSRRAADERVAGSVDEERAKLVRALERATARTAALVEPDDPFCDIFAAQQTVLADPDLRRQLVGQLERHGTTAERAVARVFGDLRQQFSALVSDFAAQRHADIVDIRDRIEEQLGLTWRDDGSTAGPQVWLMDEARPSQLLTLDRRRVAAVVSTRGGGQSHAAIIARGRGVPLVFDPDDQAKRFADGQWVRADGGAGTVNGPVAPPATPGLPAEPEVTDGGPLLNADGDQVTVRANLGAPGDLALAQQVGCQGCGLLRTELLFAGRDSAPSEEEQAQAYGRIARALAPQPLVIRLFDAGSDKPLAFLPGQPHEVNPALGLRGVRLLLRHGEILAAQLRAIATAGRQPGATVRAMVPMVNDPSELAAVARLCPDDLELGVMIETPAAVTMAHELAERAAFFSIGSNDLAQYALARDREGVAEAGQTHPALLRLIQATVQAAHRATIRCSVCGELAGDPAVAPLLLGLGVDALSVTPRAVPALRACLASLSARRMRAMASEATSWDNGRDVP